jgi:PleD family two-component response regulator
VRDRLLREIGSVLQRDLRLTDVAGRWADGRFYVALTGTDRTGAELVAQRLSRHLDELESAHGLGGMLPRPEVVAAGGPDAIASQELN